MSAFKNVVIHDYSASQIKRHIFLSVPCYFSRTAFSEYSVVRKNKGLRLEYLKECARLFTVGDFIYKIIKKILMLDKSKEWVIDSYWFSNSAYAAAKVKKNFPYVYAFTRAHSFEIDPIKNSYYYAGGKNFVQRYIDEILFISEAGKRFYLKSIINQYNIDNKNASNKCKVYRLGTIKKYDVMTPSSTDGVFRVVSCSRIDVEKRVEVIAEVIKNWNLSKIEWTHFGGGNSADIEKMLEGVDSAKINVNLMGFCANEKIHKYYSQNPVDVFVSLSSSEGVPVSMMEAQSYGIPILATDVGGVSEIVNNDNGMLISVDASVEQVLSALEHFRPGTTQQSGTENKRILSYQNWSSRYSEIANDNLLLEHVMTKK